MQPHKNVSFTEISQRQTKGRQASYHIKKFSVMPAASIAALQVQMIVSTIGQDWSLGNAALVTATKHSVEIIKSVYIQW